MIILLDLNYTLVSNSNVKKSPFINQIAGEMYRKDLLEFLSGGIEHFKRINKLLNSFAKSKATLHYSDFGLSVMDEDTIRHIILITARPIKYKEATLANIHKQTGVRFFESYFNDGHLAPHLFKKKTFIEKIQPIHPGENFVAVESNPRTIEEYKKLGILCLSVQ